MCGMLNTLNVKLSNYNFRQLEVECRWSDPQLQVSKIIQSRRQLFSTNLRDETFHIQKLSFKLAQQIQKS